MVLPTIEVLIKCWFSVYRDVRLRKREKCSICYVGWDAWQLLAWDTVRSSVVQVGDTEWVGEEGGGLSWSVEWTNQNLAIGGNLRFEKETTAGLSVALVSQWQKSIHLINTCN